jgi:23S rRNA (guanosine2251-2'-O)-methyltransferase
MISKRILGYLLLILPSCVSLLHSSSGSSRTTLKVTRNFESKMFLSYIISSSSTATTATTTMKLWKLNTGKLSRYSFLSSYKSKYISNNHDSHYQTVSNSESKLLFSTSSSIIYDSTISSNNGFFRQSSSLQNFPLQQSRKAQSLAVATDSLSRQSHRVNTSRLYSTLNNNNNQRNQNDSINVNGDATTGPDEVYTSDNDVDVESNDDDISKQRKVELDKALHGLNIDVIAFTSAVQQSINNPIQGYDGRYGKSAIKAYRSFVHSSKSTSSAMSSNNDRTIALAQQTARQIQFLLNRHKAHQMEWIRHHDGSTEQEEKLTLTSLENDHGEKQQQQQQHSKKEKYPIIIILDNVRSAMNVGNIFRTIDATNCEAIYTIGITPHPYGNGHDKLIKSSLGTHNTVQHKHFISLYDSIHYIRSNNHNNITANVDNTLQPVNGIGNNQQTHLLKSNYTILCMETTSKSICYTDYVYGSTITGTSSTDASIDDNDDNKNDDSNGIVLVFGNEVTGVDVDFMNQYADSILEIPMYGIKNSLNIAACVPIVVYEIIRQWNSKRKVK